VREDHRVIEIVERSWGPVELGDEHADRRIDVAVEVNVQGGVQDHVQVNVDGRS
jgi:hypothetical protein